MTSAYASSILRKTLCHASQAQKNETTMKRAKFKKIRNLQKPKPLSFMLILLALLAMMAIAPAMWAQNSGQYPYPANLNDLTEWQGENNGKFKITADSTKINRLVDVHSDDGTPCVLVLYPVGTPVVVKETTNTELFKVRDKGELHIIGRVGDTLKIYGNCGNGTEENPTPIPTRTNYQGSCIRSIGTDVLNPKIWLKYVEFYGFVTHTSINDDEGNNTGQGGIVTMGASASPVVGACHMKHVTFKNSYGGPVVTNHYKGYGRIISFVSGTWTVTLDNVKIHDCLISEPLNGYYIGDRKIGGMGSVIRSQGQVGGSLTMTNCVAYNNTYRDLSGSKNNSILDYKNMNQIKSKPLSGQGGVINWRSGRKSENNAQVTIKNCHFHHNSAQCGGAVATCATINMDHTELNNNEAERGGGVYFYTYNGTDAPYDGHGFRAIFGEEVDIHHNSATKYGGGAYLTFDASDDVGFDENDQPISPEFSLEINEKSEIHDNKAPKGAGIVLMDACPYSHYYSDIDKWSLEYQRTVNLNGGKVYNNYAQGTTGEEMAGGGIYIEKYEYSSGHPLVGFHTDYTNNPDPLAQNNSGTITVNLARGEIYNNSAVNNTKPGKGGGVYIASKFMTNTIKSTLNVNIGEAGKVLQMYNNQAYTDGGGVYVLYDRTDSRQNQGTVTVADGSIGFYEYIDEDDNNNIVKVSSPNKALTGNGGGICVMGGTVSVNGGNIEYNTAGTSGGGVYVSVPNNESITTIQKANISNNTATNGNGGGVCLDRGRINIYGSDISNNKATKGNGGGLYIEEGDIIVWPKEMLDNPNAPVFSQCEDTKTTVLNNTAGGNGGGLNTHRGRFDVRFAQIKNNTAGYNYSGNGGGNGGGLFCDGTDNDNGYTVRLLHCDLEENKALGNVLVGDGITGRGGGVYLKHGSIFAEHCDIIKNEADINGGGLDNHSGELRVYGTYIDENKAHEGRGGGLYTEEGNIVVGPCDTYGYKNSKASRIILNKAKLNGGGINNHRGDITIHGDIINENEAETGDGGGVYINSGNIFMYGGQINNNKADKGKGGGVYGGGGQFNIKERKANPIVEILEVEDIKATGFKVHYHLVDRGKVPIKVTGDGPDFNYEDLNNLTHGVSYIKNGKAWADSSYVEYNSEIHRYVLSEGCVRIPLTLSASQLYHVKAYAKYSHEEEDYFDASPVLLIATTGAKPVVATGEASEINQNSAKVTGKLFYKGDNDAGVVTKGIRYSKDGEDSWTNVDSYGSEDEFSVTLAGLDSGTAYQAQAYATNDDDTGYGEIIEFTTATATGSKAPQGPRSVYPAVEENPFFQELTPLQQAMLANTPEGDTTAAPASRAITDRDDPDPKAPENIPQINGNTARYGGGICIDKNGAKLVFSGTKGEVSAEGKGQINKNYASEAGGGIYIGYQTEGENPGPAMMQMMGKCEVNYNHVPASKQGGGIYLDGRLYVGDQATDDDDVHGLKVDRNFASDTEQTTWVTYPWNETYPPDNSKLNNVFLPRSEYEYPEHENSNAHDNKISVITLLSDISGYKNNDSDPAFDPDEDEPYSCIGFSVLKGFCPVIATAEEFGGSYANVTEPDAKEDWMYQLMLMSGVDEENHTAEKLTGAIFEDSESYVAVHTRRNMAPFLGKFVYLWGCWTHPIVKTDPEKDNPMSKLGYGEHFLGHYKIKNPGDYKKNGTEPLKWEIYSPEGLAWFTSYVNGLNAFDEASGNSDSDEDHHAWNVNQNPKAIATIMNDLDMSAYLWVPIGSVQKFQNTIGNNNNGSNNGSLFNDSEETVTGYTPDKHKYCGKFDGQGHIIKGLQGLYLTGIKKFGLFGYLTEGAEVNNVFVDEGLFMSDNTDIEYAAGGIAGEMDGGTLTNSEARMNFNSTYSKSGTTVGGLVGDLKGGSIHSCMAMPTFTTSTTTNGQYVGGLVGKMDAGTTLKNSFSNVLFTTTPDYKVGGIAGENNGLIENVYVRYNYENNTPNLANTKFYWIAGLNKGSISYCFSPKDNTGSGKWVYTGPSSTAASLRRTYQPTKLENNKYGFAHQDQDAETYDGDATTYIANGPIDNDGNLKGLLASLNNWVADNSGYTPWTRTMASTINDDYPVLMFNDFNVVGTEDGIYMKYDDNVNDMWKKPNYESLDIAKRTGKDFQGLTSYNNPKAAMYLYKTNPTAINVSGNEAVRLYIHENVGVTQTDGAELHARVGVTFDNSNKSLALGGKAYDWHMFSSALKAAPLGITYHSGNTNPNTGGKSYSIKNEFARLKTEGIIDDDDNYRSREYMDPPVTTWNTAPGTVGYFPTNTPYGQWGNGHWPSSDAFSNTEENPYSFDFYCFHEESRHWINFKREGTTEFMDHWHQDIDGSGKHQNLWYENESTLQVGKGYMMGVSAVSMLMADGILNNGVKSNENEPAGISSAEDLTNSDYGFNPSGYSEELRGTNLVGNPFQSYLNFSALANDDDNKNIIENGTYYLFDADARRYLCYPADASTNPINAPQFIHPHQGFFVKTANGGNLTFKNSMRSATAGNGSTFRGDNLNYPLVNLFCYDAEGHYDVTTVEMNRPKLGGGSKLKDMRNGNSLIYARLEDEDYQTLFAPTGTSTVPVRFEPSQDGVYTMRWGTLHGDFHYLHLVDNMSGADVDMLRSEEYRFEATTSDYISRFKLVFEVTDVEENPIEAEATTFAFRMGDEIIVNGAGYLEVFDVQGRRLSAKRLVDAQSSVSLPYVAAGIYFLRLSDDKQVRTQKMVINY